MTQGVYYGLKYIEFPYLKLLIRSSIKGTLARCIISKYQNFVINSDGTRNINPSTNLMYNGYNVKNKNKCAMCIIFVFIFLFKKILMIGAIWKVRKLSSKEVCKLIYFTCLCSSIKFAGWKVKSKYIYELWAQCQYGLRDPFQKLIKHKMTIHSICWNKHDHLLITQLRRHKIRNYNTFRLRSIQKHIKKHNRLRELAHKDGSNPPTFSENSTPTTSKWRLNKYNITKTSTY